MNLLVPTLLSLSPLIASNPIDSTYRPEIQIQLLRSEWSIYGCTIENYQILGKDPVTLKERAVTVDLYRAKEPTTRAVIILPPTGGVNILDQGYANELCFSGITAAVVSGWEHSEEISLDLNMHNNLALRALAASRHVVEFLHAKSIHSIGILGTSIGALASSLVLEFEPRISAAALIVGSARFADVIAESDEEGASDLRRARMQTYGFQNTEEYKRALREKIWVEPSHFMDRFTIKDTFIVTADEDTTVPTAYQLELAQMLNTKHHLQLPGDHLQVIKDTFWYHRGKILNFFIENL